MMAELMTIEVFLAIPIVMLLWVLGIFCLPIEPMQTEGKKRLVALTVLEKLKESHGGKTQGGKFTDTFCLDSKGGA